MLQDHQDGQQPKVDCRHHKEVYRADLSRMTGQKSLSRLAKPAGPALMLLVGTGHRLAVSLSHIDGCQGCRPANGVECPSNIATEAHMATDVIGIDLGTNSVSP
jgi:hypothetical protein